MPGHRHAALSVDAPSVVVLVRPRTMKPRSTDDQTSEPLMLACDTHGRVMWAGHIACEGCGRLYRYAPPGAPLRAPDMCACGLRLLPDGRCRRYSAVPVCPHCYRQRLSA